MSKDRDWWKFVCTANPEHKDCCIRLVDMPEDCPACGAAITKTKMTEGEIEAENCNGEQ